MNNQKIYRSKKNRMLFGVAGGIGEYFKVDPTIVRLIFVVLTIWGGVGIILYIIAIFIIPEENGHNQKNPNVGETVNKAATEIKDKINKNDYRSSQIFGLIVLILGMIFLLRSFIPYNFWKLWPLILVAIGFSLIVSRKSAK